MRWIILAACLVGAAALADEPDPLIVGRALLGGPERERGVAMLRKVIAEGDAARADATKQQRAGRAHHFLNEDTEAVAALERAMALEPNNARHAFWLGRILLPIDVDRSLAAFEKATTLDPEDPHSWYGLGRARDGKEDLRGALEAFAKSTDLDPAYTEAHYRAGSVLWRSGRNEEAIARYRKVLALDAASVDAGRDLGQLEYLAGRFEKARDAWLSVEPYAEGEIDLRARIVQALFALGKYAEAEPWRAKVRTLHAESKDEEIRKQTAYCFDRFTVGDLDVVAYEVFDRSEDALYRYIFQVLRDGTQAFRVNLEPKEAAPGLGLSGEGFFLGRNDEGGHTTFDKDWDAEPPYPELKRAVIDAIQGKVPWATRSRRAPPKSPAERDR